MAENDDLNIKISTTIDTANSAKSLQDLKKSMKELQNLTQTVGEGSAQFNKLSQAIAKGKDKIDDLNDSVNSLKGSGVEKLTGSINLLKEGFTNADPGKLSVGMKALGTAMLAIPIFLIIEGIKYLIENFEKLKSSSGLIGKAFTAIGDAITWVTDKISAFTDWIGLTTVAQNKLTDSIITSNASIKKSVGDRYDSEISAAKRAGEETQLLEIAKQKAFLETNKIAISAIEARIARSGTASKEDKELLEKLKAENVSANKAILDNWDEYQDNKLATAKKYKEEHDKIKAEEVAASGKAWMEEVAAKKAAEDALAAIEDAANAKALASTESLITKTGELKDAEELRLAENEQARLAIKRERDIAEIDEELIKSNGSIEAYAAAADAIKAIDDKYNADKTALAIKTAEDITKADKAEAEKRHKNELDAATRTTQGLQGLSDLYFAIKSANTKKGSAEDLKNAKQQFKINKALSLATAVISGIQGTIAAFSSGAAVPVAGAVLGPLYAVAAAAAATANIAKIAGTQFDSGGSTSSSPTSYTPAVNTPTPADTPVPNKPDFSVFGNGNGNQNNVGSQQITVNAVVVAQEITDAQTQNNYSNSLGAL